MFFFKIGEILCVETPVRCSLNNDLSGCAPTNLTGTRCDNCLGECGPAPLPCPSCSRVVFCSLSCLKTAAASYHGFECGLEESISRHVTQHNILPSFPQVSSVSQ